jgi:hypothetical protein
LYGLDANAAYADDAQRQLEKMQPQLLAIDEFTILWRACPGTTRRSNILTYLSNQLRVSIVASGVCWQGYENSVNGLDIGRLHEVRAKSRFAGSLTIAFLTVAGQCDQMHSLGSGISA